MKSLLIISFLSIVFLNNCFNDLDCLFEFPDENNRITIMEIKSNSNYAEFEILRTTSFVGEGVNFPYEYALYFDGYTDDIDYSYIDNEGVANYGLNLSFFQESLLLRDFKLDNSFLDFLPTKNQVLTRDVETEYFRIPNSTDSLYLSSIVIVKKDFITSSSDTLFKTKPTLVDTAKFETEYFFDAFFDNQENVIFLVTRIHNTLEERNSGDKYLESENIEHYLLRIQNLSGVIDTLYKQKSLGGLDRPEFFTNKFGTFLKLDNGDVISIDNDGNLSNLEFTTLPQQFNSDGSISVDGLKLYAHNYSSNEEIYFSESFDRLRYAFPGKSKLVAIEYQNSDSLYIYDIVSKKIVETIDINQIPAFPSISNEDFSVYDFRNPLLNENDELIVMAVQRSFLLDPDFRCYD